TLDGLVQPLHLLQLLDLPPELAQKLRAIPAQLLRLGGLAPGLGLLPADDQVEYRVTIRRHRLTSSSSGTSPCRAFRIISRAEAQRRWIVLVATPSASAAW